MKISKFVKLVKNAGRCIVADVENSGIWLGNGYGFYRATNLPRMEGAEQVRTVLDVPEKAWEKVYLTEEWYGNAQNVMGMNLLAAIMPMRVVSEEYLGRLAEFEAMCAEQLNRERARAEGATEAENQEDGEQLGMEDAEE